VRHLLPLVPFIVPVGAYYVLVGRKVTDREVAALVLGLLAVLPLLDGGFLLVQEYDRWHEGHIANGVVAGKLSSTGAEGSRTIGGQRLSRPSHRTPEVVTSNDFALHDVVARVLLTGSREAWIVEYLYPCDSGRQCRRRESVRKALWSTLHVGQTVPVVSAHNAPGRLDANPLWGTAVAKLAMGGVLGLLAGLLSGRLRRARPTYVTVPGVVTSVEPIPAGGKVHWRVGFAYFSADGIAYQSVDEVYVAGLQPRDTCTVVYPPDQPDLGTLRSVSNPPRQSAEAAAPSLIQDQVSG
jgi:hypothetical protein